MVKGRWACLPLSYRFYHLKKSIEQRKQARSKPEIEFETKIEQAVNMITDIAEVFNHTRIIVTTDSWFGNNGLWKPLHKKLGQWFHMISRLRSNNNVFDLPGSRTKISILCPVPRKSAVNSLVAILLRIAACYFYGKL